MNILIIGGGNMGLTYAQSFLRSRIVTSNNLMVLCRSYEKANQLSQTQEGRFYTDPRLCVPEADLVIFAVKPQDAANLFQDIQEFADPGQVFLSIMAGIQMGFSDSESELLVGQTFTGAVDLYNKADHSCESWIKKVASKGGTTEAALQVFRETALHEDIVAGAQAALVRARELGQ